MKLRSIVAGVLLAAMLPMTAFAAEWKRDNVGWWYQEDNGSYPVNCWKEVNGKWYYFGANGYMLENTTTPDGYQVGADGAWVQNTASATQVSGSGVGGDGNGSVWYIKASDLSEIDPEDWPDWAFLDKSQWPAYAFG